MKYRSKPVEVQAVQWTGRNVTELIEFAGSALRMAGSALVVRRKAGDVALSIGDYLVRGAKGEFDACRAEAFHEIYEPAA